MNFWEYLGEHHRQLLTDAGRHAAVVLPCTVAATVLGVLIGVAAHRGARAGALAANATAALSAVPALAVIGLLVPVAGPGLPPTVTALTLLGLVPVARSAVVGLRGVDPALLDAADGIGMSRPARLARVELPLAWPAVLTGIRGATRTLTGVAALAACVSGPGLGNPILRGIASPDGGDALAQVLAGTLGIVVLALLLDAAYVLVGRLTVPGGIRA
ncbi:ABC transporter permease [Streptomyces griseomycini]|uniref:Osmoprotectant transport system permease protein n=1 Tax=Streptomyces griseomycini TaxID=66895 RepID=A0A7W7PTQ7_9ACTN|nr:ABC transporter permease subunit [Streptomyces griseomycini]MBB4901131.1 osmoprotectant transport system permease protein [Streptomyces griseomycini]GGP88595.1 ABC transporter permease [Streptomyces griseomycini]GGR17206.1 ABC transporter permease [Streptomyces griseomycini]